jgi:hypothetical protein
MFARRPSKDGTGECVEVAGVGVGEAAVGLGLGVWPESTICANRTANKICRHATLNRIFVAVFID